MKPLIINKSAPHLLKSSLFINYKLILQVNNKATGSLTNRAVLTGTNIPIRHAQVSNKILRSNVNHKGGNVTG